MDLIQQMRVVVAIAERGSLTSAADYLGTSSPTVVRILAAAERRLGARLFDRTTRRVHITDEGLLYVDSCRRVLDEVAGIEDILRDRRTEPVGALSISAPVLFGRLHVSPVVNQFLLHHPKVTARLMLLDRVVDLTEEGVDVAIRIGPIKDHGLVAATLGYVRRQVCATPAFLSGHSPIETPVCLADVPFIQTLGLMPGNQIAFGIPNGISEVKIQNIRLSTSHADTAIAACLDGLGVGVFLSYQIQHAVAAGLLRVILPEHEPEPLPVSLVYAPSRRLSIRAQAFIGWAKKELGARLMR